MRVRTLATGYLIARSERTATVTFSLRQVPVSVFVTKTYLPSERAQGPRSRLKKTPLWGKSLRKRDVQADELTRIDSGEVLHLVLHNHQPN